jgi:hypothetical protein
MINSNSCAATLGQLSKQASANLTSTSCWWPVLPSKAIEQRIGCKLPRIPIESHVHFPHPNAELIATYRRAEADAALKFELIKVVKKKSESDPGGAEHGCQSCEAAGRLYSKARRNRRCARPLSALHRRYSGFYFSRFQHFLVVDIQLAPPLPTTVEKNRPR